MDSIIFDVDGTLWDSTGIVAEAWSDYLIHTEHMDTDVSAKRLMGLFGQLLPDIAKALFPELPEAEQLRIIDGCCQAEHEALLRKCAPLYPDLEETLKILSSRFPGYTISPMPVPQSPSTAINMVFLIHPSLPIQLQIIGTLQE